jgi:hypothetical protein
MNLKDEDLVSAVALVVDTGEETAAPVVEEGSEQGPEQDSETPEV